MVPFRSVLAVDPGSSTSPHRCRTRTDQHLNTTVRDAPGDPDERSIVSGSTVSVLVQTTAFEVSGDFRRPRRVRQVSSTLSVWVVTRSGRAEPFLVVQQSQSHPLQGFSSSRRRDLVLMVAGLGPSFPPGEAVEREPDEW